MTTSRDNPFETRPSTDAPAVGVEFADVVGEMARDAASAVWRFGEDNIGIDRVGNGPMPRLVTDVWVFDERYEQTLLVRHPVRGWVMPGGKVEAGETVRDAAVRELSEETGLVARPADLIPAAAMGGPDEWVDDRCWAVSYHWIAPTDSPLRGEAGRPVQWWSLVDEWDSVYPHDRERLVNHAHLLGQSRRSP